MSSERCRAKRTIEASAEAQTGCGRSPRAPHLGTAKLKLALHGPAAALRQQATSSTNAILLHALRLRHLAARLTAPEEPLALHVAAAALCQLPTSTTDSILLQALRLLLHANLAGASKQVLALHVSAARAPRMALFRLRCTSLRTCHDFRRSFERHVLPHTRRVLLNAICIHPESSPRCVVQRRRTHGNCKSTVCNRCTLHLATAEKLRALHFTTTALCQLAGSSADSILLDTLRLCCLASYLAASEQRRALHVTTAALCQLTRSSADTVLLHALR
mmetsp:Transcript_125310/g.400537  ORF Transcript_125310/g.400537 Transcript_125310/m.400537 type:complete len:276 (-) Transcript_125310:152-979(-)